MHQHPTRIYVRVPLAHFYIGLFTFVGFWLALGALVLLWLNAAPAVP